jgi:hypothetical protein
MEHNDKLRERVERVISECNDILKALEVKLAKYSPSSFRQAKEIDDTVVRLKRQGLPVPPELTEIRLKLVADSGEYEHLSSLLEGFHHKMQGLLAHPLLVNLQASQNKNKKGRSKTVTSPNYERPLGSKGNSNLEDYLIPVLKLMNEGREYTEAFHIVAKGLDVRYNTVSSQCTRALGLSTDEFVSRVKSGRIIDLLESRYPDQVALIKRELIGS